MQRPFVDSRLASSCAQAQQTASLPFARATQSGNGFRAHCAISQRKTRAVHPTRQVHTVGSLSPQRSSKPALAQQHSHLPSLTCRTPFHSQPARQSHCLGLIPEAAGTAGCSRRKHKPSSTTTSALQDATSGITAPSEHPWTVCKRWLQSAFPLLRNEELLSRAAWTVMIVAIARLGLHLKLPYVNRAVRPRSDTPGADMEEWFLGSKDLPDSMFNLGIGPVINASIVVGVFMTMSSLGAFGPESKQQMEQLKEGGEEGHAVIQARSNWFATCCALILGVWEAYRMKSSALTEGVPFIFLTSVILAAGSATLRWLADSVEAQGLGEGITLLIALNIVSGIFTCFKIDVKLPFKLTSDCYLRCVADSVEAQGLGEGITLLIALNIVSGYTSVIDKMVVTVGAGQVPQTQLALLVLAYMGLVALAVIITAITLRLPLVYYKQRRSKVPQESLDKRKAASEALGTPQLTVDNAYLPISLNPSGMSAVLYASFLYQTPMLIHMVNQQAAATLNQFLMQSRFANLMYGAVVFVCGVVQIGQDTPKSMTQYLSHIEAGIEGISPGPSTEKYLRRTMNIMRFWGALMVAILASAAHAFDAQCMAILGTNVGSVSLLLVVGFITSVIRQVQSLLQIPALERAMNRERDVLQRITINAAAA